MMYIFAGDEILEFSTYPLNPQHPLGTWLYNSFNGYWYTCTKGTMETFWSWQANKDNVPEKHLLQLLLIGVST